MDDGHCKSSNEGKRFHVVVAGTRTNRDESKTSGGCMQHQHMTVGDFKINDDNI
jgi:hypothetical protein